MPHFDSRQVAVNYDFIHHPLMRKVRRLALEMAEDTAEFLGRGQGELLRQAVNRAAEYRALMKHGNHAEKKEEAEKWMKP